MHGNRQLERERSPERHTALPDVDTGLLPADGDEHDCAKAALAFAAGVRQSQKNPQVMRSASPVLL